MASSPTLGLHQFHTNCNLILGKACVNYLLAWYEHGSGCAKNDLGDCRVLSYCIAPTSRGGASKGFPYEAENMSGFYVRNFHIGFG